MPDNSKNNMSSEENLFFNIIAHRGSQENRNPENTMPAFEEAFKNNFDIELDIHLSKDNHIVIIHDETLDRTSSDGKGEVQTFTLNELRKFNLSKNVPNAIKTQILTLSEFLDKAKELNYRGNINIEIKTDEIQYKDIEKKAYDLINEKGFVPQIIFSSFYHDSIKNIREYESSIGINSNKSVKVALLYDKNKIPDINTLTSQLNEVNAFSLNISHEDANLDLIKNVKNIIPQIKVLCFTVNNIDRANKLIENGVDGIFSVNPITLSKELKKKLFKISKNKFKTTIYRNKRTIIKKPNENFHEVDYSRKRNANFTKLSDKVTKKIK